MSIYDHKTLKFCREKMDIPPGDHFAILVFETRSVDDGYGDGPSTMHYVEYLAFTDRAEWEAEIRERSVPDPKYSFSKKDFIPIVVRQPTVKTTVSVEISS